MTLLSTCCAAGTGAAGDVGCRGVRGRTLQGGCGTERCVGGVRWHALWQRPVCSPCSNGARLCCTCGACQTAYPRGHSAFNNNRKASAAQGGNGAEAGTCVAWHVGTIRQLPRYVSHAVKNRAGAWRKHGSTATSTRSVTADAERGSSEVMHNRTTPVCLWVTYGAAAPRKWRPCRAMAATEAEEAAAAAAAAARGPCTRA